MKEAYAHPEIIHNPKTFLYRPHEKGSLGPIKDMWWSYLERSPWKGIKPVKTGGMGMKEKLLRWVYTHTSKPFREWFYIASRKYYGLLGAIVQPPYKVFVSNLFRIQRRILLRLFQQYLRYVLYGGGNSLKVAYSADTN